MILNALILILLMYNENYIMNDKYNIRDISVDLCC